MGSSAAIGSSLGFSGLLAVAIGTAINTIAAIVVTELVGTVATKVLGEQLGQIIGTVISTIVTLGTVGGGGFSLDTFTNNLANIGNIKNLITLTNSATNIVSAIQQGKIEDINEQIQSITEQHNEELDKVEQQFEALGLGSGGVIDPILLTDFTTVFSEFGENFSPNSFEFPDDFINRTLMTGQDLIEISLNMVTEFADISLTLS